MCGQELVHPTGHQPVKAWLVHRGRNVVVVLGEPGKEWLKTHEIWTDQSKWENNIFGGFQFWTYLSYRCRTVDKVGPSVNAETILMCDNLTCQKNPPPESVMLDQHQIRWSDELQNSGSKPSKHHGKLNHSHPLTPHVDMD